MERRKSKLDKILLTIDLIREEKLSIQDNLDLVLQQVFSKANHLKGNRESIRQKDISNIHKSIIEALRQLCDINSVLEILLEDNDTPCDNHDQNKSLCAGKQRSSAETSRWSPTTLPFESSIENTPTTTVIPELPATIEVEHRDCDIQSLKKSLSEFSEKLGLNKQNFSDIKDYYEKPCSFQTVISETASHSEHLVSKNGSEYSEKTYDMPEKDINPSTNNTDQPFFDVLRTGTSKHHSVCLDYTAKEISDSASPAMSLSESSSGYADLDHDSITGVNSECKIEKHSVIQNNYSALEKLNNLRIKEDDNSESTTLPDIRLKPSGSVIKNFIPSDDRGCKMKKKQKNNQIFFDLKPKDMPRVGEECLISHVESPFEFYIHINDEMTILIDEIGEEIGMYFENNKKINYDSKEEALNEIGKFALAYIDKYVNWYRVKILDGYENETHDEVLVHLIDYGNKKLISYKYLQSMTEEMSKIPMLALQCHFPLLYPPESTHLNRLTTWPISTIELMLNMSGLVGDDSNRFFKILYVNLEENNSIAIDLYRLDWENEEWTFGQVLLDMGLAVQLTDDYDANNLDVEMFTDDIDNLEVDNINEAITGYDPKDEARICRFTKRDGSCYKGKNCKLEHVPLSKTGFTTDQETVFAEAMYPLILPPSNTTVTILITGYIDPCKFFAQIIHKACPEKKYVIDQDMYLLLQDMNSSKIIKTYEPFKISPAIGEIVMVYRWNKWLRAVVREFKTGEQGEAIEVQVFTLDFGENVKATMKDIRKIKPHFLKLPFQAVECYICGYQMKKNCSIQEARNFFYQNLYFHNFMATTKSSNPPLQLKLTNKNASMVVGEILEAKGFAEKRRTDFNVADDCGICLC